MFPAAVLLSAVLALSACDDRPPETAGGSEPPAAADPQEEEILEPVVVGYGADWTSTDCESLLRLAVSPEMRICGVIGQGERPDLDLILDRDQPSKKAGLYTVEVNSPEAPVLLFLYEYRTTLWHIKTTPGTEVAAASVNGYESQAVTGLNPEVLTAVSYNGQGSKPCKWASSGGGLFSSGIKPNSRQAMTDYLQEILGRNPDFITEINDGRAVCGWPVPPGTEFAYEDFRPEGLDAFAGLINQLNRGLVSGLIRPARHDDLEAYKNARSMGGHLLIADDQGWERPPDAYVVESGDFVFPEIYQPGDKESERVFTFLIPPGLSLPEGPLKGIRVLFMDDGSCLGSKCGHGQGIYQASAKPRFAAPDLKLAPECRLDGLKLPEGTQIYAGGGYEGQKTDRPAPEQADSGGGGFAGAMAGSRSRSAIQRNWGRMEVTVNSPDHPAVLILSAYHPTEWHLDIRPGTTIAAVVLSGYHFQKLVNPPAGVPVVGGSYDDKRCWSFYFDPQNFVRINQVSENLFGRVPDRGFPAVGGRLVIDSTLPPRIISRPV